MDGSRGNLKLNRGSIPIPVGTGAQTGIGIRIVQEMVRQQFFIYPNAHPLNIKLIKSGGLIGKKMSASAEWTFSDKEWQDLLAAIKREEGAGKMRDAFHYSVQLGDDENSRVPVSIQGIPSKYSAVFKKLFDNMKAEK